MLHLASRRWVLVLVLLALAPVPLTAAEQTPEEEPPLQFVLEINGQPHEVRLDQPVKVNVAPGEATLKLTARPERLFDKGGVSFLYPATFGFDYAREDHDQWKVSGGDTTLMLFRFDGSHNPQVLLAAMIGAMMQQYGEANATKSPATITLGGRTLGGQRIEARVAGQPIRQDLFTFQGREHVFVFMVQDALGADGKTTADTRRVLDLLKGSFKFPAAAPAAP